MEQLFHYGTISEAIDNFKKQGYTIDFNLDENSFIYEGDNKYELEDFEIVDLYRYEGDSDPGDSAIVFAIESTSGLKGTLVAAYGIYSDPNVSKMIEKLHYRK